MSERGRIVRTMQPASKTISAFLNSHGGRIFIGIDDNGVVKGLRLTKNMIDHFYLSLHHSLQQFNPVVPPNLVRVSFHEVIEVEDEEENKKYFQGSDDDFSDDDGDITERKQFSEWYMKEHHIGGKKCECHIKNINQSKLYVIIIKVIAPGDGTLFQNEEGLVYRRRNSSNKMLTIDEVRQFIETDIIPFEDPRSNWSACINYVKNLFN